MGRCLGEFGHASVRDFAQHKHQNSSRSLTGDILGRNWLSRAL
jgi:hypothetical protein